MEKRNIAIGLPSMGIEEWEACKGPIESGWITQGPKVKEFETNFALRHNVKHAFAVSNCTTALHLGLLACGVKEGDEVIVPAFTWVSTANAVKYCGAKPIFVDIDINTFNINVDKIEEKITDKTTAIIPVHLYGMPAKMDEILSIAKEFNIPIIEDAAESLGSNINDKPCGSFGNFGVLSFNGNKIITTSGGGALMDVGIYCINGSRYMLGEEPIWVTAQETKTDKVKFKEGIDETIQFQLGFPSGAISSCMTSYSQNNINSFFLNGTEGFVEMNPANNYGPIKAKVNSKELNFPTIKQQTLQMEAFADYILNGIEPKIQVDGLEGLKDLKIIEAIYSSIKLNKKIILS